MASGWCLLPWVGLASCHSQMPLSPNATATLAQAAFGGQRLRQGRLAVTSYHSLSLRNLLILGMMGSSPSPSWDSPHPTAPCLADKLLRMRPPSPCARRGAGDRVGCDVGMETATAGHRMLPRLGFLKQVTNSHGLQGRSWVCGSTRLWGNERAWREFSVLHSLRVGRDWSRISECFLSELPPPSPGTELSSLCSHEHQPEFSLLLFSGWRAAEVPNLHSQEKDGSSPAVTAPPLTLQLQPKSCPQEKEHCWGRKR